MSIAASVDLAALKQSAESTPGSIDRWLDLCAAAEKLGDYAEVLRAGDRIVQLAPGKPQPHFIRGLALHRLDRIEDAIAAYKRVLEYDPYYVDAWVNLGHCCQALNRIDDAEHACRRAIEASGQKISDEDKRDVAESEYGNHHWNLAVIELLKGDYARGFKRYPSRYKAIAGKKRPDLAQPLWRGEDPAGKSILVTADQGYGDTLMMARYLPLLKARRAKVFLQAPPPLVPLLKNWNGVDQVLEQGRDPLPPFDFHASEFDLPRYFGTTLESIPAATPYLPIPSPDDSTRLPESSGLRVGVIWSGNPDHRNDKRRSIPLQDFSLLFTVRDIEFFSLNRDMRPGDSEILAKHPVNDVAPRIRDFAVTARFIAQLDLVITCDTSTAHLAGGMGRPVWVLLPFAPSWHWMLERADSPWYPGMRLFRQKDLGGWSVTLTNVREALSEWQKIAVKPGPSE